MNHPPQLGESLFVQIEATGATRPHLWSLGGCGFAIKYFDIVFYADPLLHPASASRVRHADMVLATHAAPAHMHGETLRAILDASPKAKLVLPKSTAETAFALGVPYHRMTTTDSGLRVEYFKNGMYARIYAVPSANPELDATPLGGYPYLGYLIRCGDTTIYHAGACRTYETLADRLRPYNVTVAILPVAGEANFSVEDAADLAASIGAHWLVPMHPQGPEDPAFLNHMLFHRPQQRFKIFQPGEGWAIPALDQEP
ncbi:MAG: MBL fold metallo-hydrolase [Acidobacteria bacterium]|nr:MBL fold metallo-hydrolase [Acidobacteriota bacterium]